MPQSAGRVSALASRGTKWVLPSPILKDGHNSSIGQFLDSVTRSVDVPRSVFHLDEKLGSVGFDTMFSPVQGATIENRVPGVPIEDASRHGNHGIRLGSSAPVHRSELVIDVATEGVLQLRTPFDQAATNCSRAQST
jgi:hypothetical protein